jgi:hydroxypyruvate isomerase
MAQASVIQWSMLRLTANIGFLFTERRLLDRFAAARAAGFEAVECPYPYEHTVDELRAAIAGAGVRVTGINIPAGDRAKGEWGFAGVPGQEARFARDFDLALHYAAALGASMMHVLAGIVPADARDAARATYLANLRWAAAKAEAAGIMLLLEPLNRHDAPGYLVSHADEIAEVIAELGAPHVKLLFDAYHIQIMNGDLIRRLERHQHIIGHVQIAGVPGRNEPDAENEVNFPAVLRALEATGYQGWVGAEYRPRAGTEAGLGWLQPYIGG